MELDACQVSSFLKVRRAAPTNDVGLMFGVRAASGAVSDFTSTGLTPRSRSTNSGGKSASTRSLVSNFKPRGKLYSPGPPSIKTSLSPSISSTIHPELVKAG
jgi:hypothetical protein